VHWKAIEELELMGIGAVTGQVVGLSGHSDPINDLLIQLRIEPSAGYAALAERLDVSEATVKRYIQKLKQQNRIRRIGSKKTGHWEVME
jgi:ATP-dependent DNA helicase RecG